MPQDISAHGHHSDVSGQSGCVARMTRSTGYEPNLSQNMSGTKCMCIAASGDEDPMGVEKSPLEQAPIISKY